MRIIVFALAHRG